MPDETLKTFSESFHGDIATNAQALDILREHAFVERMNEILVDYGETEECEFCHWQDRGFKIDAYSFDDEHAALRLVVAHYLDDSDPTKARVTNSDVDAVLKRGLNFLLKSLEGKLHKRIDISNPAHDLAALIHECRKDILSAKIIMVTDGVTRERRAQPEIHDDIEVTGVVWDIDRTHTFVRTGEREQISIDFANEYGGPIPCVQRDSFGGKYTSYISFLPGDVLADLYGDWKIRLLERNVRVFLSQRPKVNRGIRDTIINEPDMFCAYNNGITVVAQNVELVALPDDCVGISRVSDFQIVNGGQTTASLYHTREKSKADLSAVQVQMKLMIINEDARPSDLPQDQRLSDVLVPKIGRYSNTQNRVQMADLLANDPPHPELYAISQNLPAPDPTGGSVQSFWFYEKSRGSYEETRRLQAKTKAQQKKFDQKYPKSQRFDKSRFGKAWNSYLRLPHVVCLGAMKSFARFNAWMQEQDEDWQEFFRKTVALVLLWNEAEKIVRRREFGGYRHAIVTYSLAWLHHITDMRIDLAKIWHEQRVEDVLLEVVDMLACDVNEHIRDTGLNVTEWCKKEDCWKELLERVPPPLPDMKDAFIGKKKSKSYDSSLASETENIEFCTSKGADVWFGLAKWLKDRDFMQGKQRSQSFNMGRTIKSKKKEPSAVLSYACRKIWTDAEALGWDPAILEDAKDEASASD